MRYLSALLFFFYTPNIYGQCPNTLTGGTNGSKDCIRLTWNAGEVPSPLPDPVNYNGSNYALEASSGNSADYKISGSNCNGVLPGAGLSGTITYGSESCTYSSGSLPVTFGTISLEQDDGVIIHWETKSELNNDFFEVQRSKDGKQWSNIGSVTGSGTSQSENKYSYWDGEPLKGISHYRIKQVDFDNSFSYSKIVSYTNPLSSSTVLLRLINEELIIDNEDEHKTYAVLNISGQIILSGKLIEGRNIISIPDLQPGIYVISISGLISQDFKIANF